DGVHFSIPAAAQASEVWVVAQMDGMIAYERTHYHTERPIAFSSWVTLDPLTHPSEPFGETEDGQSLDLNRVIMTDAPAGQFISYHAYPYYPNFINNDEKYKDKTDDMGANPYMAYIEELQSWYTHYPLLIAEFGVPTSYGTAQFSSSGMYHGGMTEEQQGQYMVRMMHNMYDTNCAGGVAFSWMDEWFKITWITNPMTEGERRPLWYNISAPENNFGLLQFNPNPQYFNTSQTNHFAEGHISTTTVSHDFLSLNLEATLNSPLTTGDTLWIAFDTYNRNLGESTLPNGKKLMTSARAEFLLRVTPDSANLYVMQDYDLFGLVFQNSRTPAFKSVLSDGNPWMPVRWQNDEFGTIHHIGRLHLHTGNNTPGQDAAVHLRNNGITVRMPWTLLQFSDPSRSQVINDAVSADICLNVIRCGKDYYLKTSRTDGIAITLVCDNTAVATTPYTWSDWEVVSALLKDKGLDHPENLNFPYDASPGYQETTRLNPDMFIEEAKASLSILSSDFKSFPFTPK
ncbi:MAG: hypothetical protein LBU62_05970, partial [Bacteroidales bacterium]|nr:hypothetical protein [Bacteroidales bacterium]